MAGLEQLEIHSKSYIVRWVKVDEGHTISWSVQPHKKSINFGIFKHPRSSNGVTLQASDETGSAIRPVEAGFDKTRRTPANRNVDASTAQDQLRAKGFIAVKWYGNCEADKVSMGTYAVDRGAGGMYGLVFDNTFSKTTSKTATFVLLTYPSNAPPHSMQSIMAGTAKNSSPTSSADLASESVDSLHLGAGSKGSRGNSVTGRNESESGLSSYHVGVLQKRRRKRGQGYARRFFSLDFESCTLSYYYNRNSSALRGAIPLSLAAIAADERRREISIDSGAEVWHLKAGNAKDFMEWTTALERASTTARDADADSTTQPGKRNVDTAGLQITTGSPEEEKEWEQVESLVSRVAGTRDAIRRLSKQTAPGARGSYAGSGVSSLSASPNFDGHEDYFSSANSEKRPFWKRKASTPTTPQMVQRGISSQLAVPSPSAVTPATAVPTPSSRKPRASLEETSIHDHCAALLRDLDGALQDFSTLLTNSKRRRNAGLKSATRVSMDSTSTAEFFDAEAGDLDRSQLLRIDRQSDEGVQPSEAEDEFVTDASSISSAGDEDAPHLNGTADLFPTKPKSLEPLPIPILVKRRKVVPPASVPPPSLIGFLRKNVGKDFSTITMPVSANEPISLLQRVAEQLEYAQILDTAASHKVATYRLLHVAAFAVSQFSSSRAKERAMRKPFNPLLGETFELVRTEKEVPGGFRLLVEKVSHRPVRMACQADSTNWSFSQSPAPVQNFWGKSAELVTEGRIRIALRLPDGSEELYSWNVATVFLRNVVMGEKYFEPVGSMAVTNETTGGKATIEFKQKGMFGGRSEDVQVDIFGPDGSPTGVGLTGTWTTSLKMQENGRGGGEIWRVGELVDNAAQRYGLTTFAASLNEITELEKGRLPPTDCRLRPDQRAAEKGDLDAAEGLKAKLEENQRVRRKEVELRGDIHTPRWFVPVDGGDDGEQGWKLKTGKDGYWEERAKGTWTGVQNILAP